MAWIESHQELARHPKTKRFARSLGVSLPAAVGHLHFFWWWAMDYAQDGDLSKYDHADIADASGWEGDPEKLYSALLDARFIDQDDTIHDWLDYAGRLVEKREKNRDRKRKSRAKEKDEHNGHAPVTRDIPVTESVVTGLPDTTQPNLTQPNQTEPNQNNNTSEVVVEMNPFRVFEQEGFGTISPVIRDQVIDLINDYGERWVCEAMKRAVFAGKRRIGYVDGILRNWKADGIDEPWTKEKPPQNKGGTGRGNKPAIPIVEPSAGEKPVSEEEFAKYMKLAEEMQSDKKGANERGQPLD